MLELGLVGGPPGFRLLLVGNSDPKPVRPPYRILGAIRQLGQVSLAGIEIPFRIQPGKPAPGAARHPILCLYGNEVITAQRGWYGQVVD